VTPRRSRRPRAWRACAATILALIAAARVDAAQDRASAQTLCVLDFQRLGDDARSDWLERGLADLMIANLGTLSPYLVIERRHLREILQEHGLAASGLIDAETAVRRAQLVKAQLLVLGSFARQGSVLAIQVRVIRVADQRLLAQATWSDHESEVLSAPRSLTDQLLNSAGHPVPPEGVEGLEHLIPTTIDEARSYYLGLGAFDDGKYPEALAHYLDAARRISAFRRAHSAVMEMYYLLGRSEHALLFARDTARGLEARRDVAGAIEYRFAAAREAFGPIDDQRSARSLLQDMLDLIARHERRSREIAGTKQAIVDRIAALPRPRGDDASKLLEDREIRERIWVGDIDAELARRSEEQARGGVAVQSGRTWIKRPAARPTMLMWKIRALVELARVHANLGEIEPALDRYQDVLDEYRFMAAHLPADGRLLSGIRTEAHFMMLRHYTTTGRLVRDHDMNRINRLNLISHGRVFTRDFRHPGPDERARVASRFEGRGHEYFDFAAPAGHQIDSVTLRAHVEGIVELGVDVPNPAGRPPRYSLSKRLTRLELSSPGLHTRTIAVPPGTELLSLSTGWGPALFANTREQIERWQQDPPRGNDLSRWEITFTVSRKRATATANPIPSGEIEPALLTVIDRYTAGWDRASAVRHGGTTFYTGTPRLDVDAEDWLAFAIDGDIRIFQQRDPRLELRLPVTINSRDREFDPSLVRARDGRYALLWARGTSRTHAARFVSFSADLLSWDTPQRLVFEAPPIPVAYTYARSEPLERSYNIVAVRSSYVMLLAQGFMRYSDDLRTWGPPVKIVAQDLDRNRLVRRRDGTIWAIYETSSNELHPYRDQDWLHGFHVVDGKRYRHTTELRVSRSHDGVAWEDSGRFSVPGRPGGLWAFELDDRRLGVALGFNNLSMQTFTASPDDGLQATGVELPFMQQSGEAQCLARDGVLTCFRPILDPVSQQPMLLTTTSERAWVGTRRP
jgi:TolB-like protein